MKPRVGMKVAYFLDGVEGGRVITAEITTVIDDDQVELKLRDGTCVMAAHADHRQARPPNTWDFIY